MASLQNAVMDGVAFAAAQGGSENPDFGALTLQVFEAVVEVVCISLPGYIVARSGGFDSGTQKAIANLNMTLFTPCLIFSKLASQLTGDRLPELVVIPFILAIQTLVSFVSAKVSVRVFGLTKTPQANFVTAMAVFGNSNSLPLSLVVSLSHTIPGLHWDKVPGDNDDEVAARGILYLLVFAQLGQALRWSWGEKQLLKPLDKYSWAERNGVPGDQQESTPFIHENGAPNKNGPHANGSASASRSPPRELAPSTSSAPLAIDGSADDAADDDDAGEPSPQHKSRMAQWLARTQRRVSAQARAAHDALPKPARTGLRWARVAAGAVLGVFNPPLTAIFVSLLVALVPGLQALFFTPRTFVANSITYAVQQLGNLAVPITLVVLGANLARNTLPDESAQDAGTRAERRKMLWLSLVCRMLLPVVVLAPLLALAAKYWNASILDDPIFVIVCFLLAGAPSALQLSQICQVNGVLVSSSAELLFHSYVIWVMPSTLVLVLLALEVVRWAA